MPRLFLLRHAKSDWTAGAKSDLERPLNPRGRKAAPLVGAEMAAENFQPDKVLCSPAVRTRQTLELLLPQLAPIDDIAFLDELYEYGGYDYSGVIKKYGNEAQALLVIGHNPLIGETALDLAGDGDAAAYSSLRQGFPTCALAVLDFDRPWSKLRPNSGTLVSYILARELARRQA